MAAQSPLTGVILVDCAKANAKNGPAIAAQRCGYGENVQSFRAALRTACDEMGVEADSLLDLLNEDQQSWSTQIGYDAAPDTQPKS